MLAKTTWAARRSGAVLAAVCMTIGFTACGGGGDDGGGSKAYVEPKEARRPRPIDDRRRRTSRSRPTRPTANAGIATIKLTAANGIHDFVFDGAYPGFILEADGGGGSQSKQIDLKPGKYTFYCSITGHRAQGMEGMLTVK